MLYKKHWDAYKTRGPNPRWTELKTGHSEKLSIIVPIHNEAKTIEKFIATVLKCHPNLEVLVGDDASSDGTREILKKYESDERIKVLYLDKNIGAGAVRNRLLEVAEGDYIAIQDADDLPGSDRFFKQIEYLKKNSDVDVVGSWADLITSDYRRWGTIKVPLRPSFWDWMLQRATVHASIMFRRKIKSHARYKEDLRFGEDYYFLTALYKKGCVFENIQESLYQYVIEPGDLLSRGKRQFKQILRAKTAISRLFSGPTRIMFLTVNFLILLIAFVRGSFLSLRD